jgi:protein-tyrosine phosphatase
VNVCSLLGRHGLAVQEAAAALVRSGRAFCVASDGHPGTREHTQQLGFHLLVRAGASSVQAWRLTQANPRFLLREGISALPLDELAVA